MSVKIISDSACDNTQGEAKELIIAILSLKTPIDGVEYEIYRNSEFKR